MKTQHIWIVLSLVLALGSVTGLGVTLSQHAAYTRGWETATSPASILPFRPPLAGVNVELAQYEENELNAQLDNMTGLGITWVRQTFPWADIEPEPGVYRWEGWDRIVEAVAGHPGLRLVAVLNLAPPWARDPLAADHRTAPPADSADFARFARLFAERYSEHIDYYQIWDEPNLAAAWGDLEPKAADYLALLRAAYTAIHEADAEATVITAGLAPTVETGPRNYSDVLFLRALYENGGQDCFDAVAGKPYGFDTGPDDRRVDEAVLNFSRLILLREEMVRHGDAHKALWASHFGWNALPENWQGSPSIWGSVSRTEQLAFVQQAYARAEREWPWSGGLILQHWQPASPPDDPVWGFSLLSPGEQQPDLPSTLFGGSASDPPEAPPGRHPAVTPFAVYQGEWEFGELGADLGQSGDSEVTLKFEGTDLALELRRANYRAYLYITVDGRQANALPVDNEGQSYLVLTSDDLEAHTDIIPVAAGLLPGSHVAHIRAERGWDQWALAAFRVSVPPDVRGYDLTAAVSVVMLLVSVGLFAALIRHISRPAVPSLWRRLWHRLAWAGQLLLAALTSVLLMVGILLTWQGSIPALLRRDPPGLMLGVVTAGLLYFSPSLVLAVIAALALWFMIYQRLELGLLLTLFWAPFFLFPLELFQHAFPMSEVCVLLTASAWVVQRLVRWASVCRSQPPAELRISFDIRRLLLSLNALDWGMLLVFVLATASLAWASYQAVAVREWRTLFLEPALFYLVLRSEVRSSRVIVRLVGTLVVSGVVVAVVGLLMYFAGRGVIAAEGGVARLAGVYGSPNNVGLFLDRVVPFVLAFGLLATRNRLRILTAFAGIVLLVTIALSQSVGAILLGVPAGVGVVLLLWNKRRGIAVLLTAGAAGILALIPLSQYPRFIRLLDFSNGTSFFRLRLWQSTLQMLKDHPIQGLGLDQFLYLYRGRYILPEAWQEPNLSHPHNILLDFWTRLGLGGVLLLIWLQVAFWRTAWRVYNTLKEKDSPLRAISIGAMGSMAALLAHGLVDNSVFVQDLSYVFALLIALPSLLDATPVDDDT